MLDIGSGDYVESPRFTPRERAAVLWAEHVTRNSARERDDVADEVRRHFSEAELVELTGVSGVFGQNNRFQDSMRLPLEEQGEIDKIKVTVRSDPARIKRYLEGLLEGWPAGFPPARTRKPRQAAGSGQSSDIATMRAPRVALLDAGTAAPDSAAFMRAAGTLLGAVTNAVRVWAHVPHASKLFLPFYTAIERDGAGSALPGEIRLMVLLKTHHVHRAPYMLAHHEELARAAGLTEMQLETIAADGWRTSPEFAPPEKAAIAWSEQVASNTAKHHQPLFDELARHFRPAEIVEITGLGAVASNADLVYNALRVPNDTPDVLESVSRSLPFDPERLRTYIRTLLSDWPAEYPMQADARRL